MRNAETRGLVLFSRNYKEKDKLVKVFTESFGKRMFFVKNFARSRFASSLQPFTALSLTGLMNEAGFSFIDDLSDTEHFSHIAEDIFINAHASYIIALADAAVPDNEYDPALYGFLIKSLELMNQGLDMEIITNIFELQVLSRFGVSLNLSECVFCHKTTGPFDFSYKYSACLCPDHYHEDPRRSHLDPNVLYLCGQFQEISLADLEKISVSDLMKGKIRTFLDGIYEEYVGLNLKAKKFLDGMAGWADVMK
ncbi:DNA repair protein RecO [Lactococcus termiticola]|nr:DNA repair protein RecO [Lactococcus termiticola]